MRLDKQVPDHVGQDEGLDLSLTPTLAENVVTTCCGTLYRDVNKDTDDRL